MCKSILLVTVFAIVALFSTSGSIYAGTNEPSPIHSESDYVFRTGQDVVIMDLTDNSFLLQ